MGVRCTPLVFALFAAGTATGTTITRVWEFGPSSAPPPLPVPIRVHQLTPGAIRIFDESGRVSDALSVRSRDDTGVAEVEAFGVAKVGAQTATDLFHFTGEGTLALFEPMREGQQLYVRPFDVDRRVFIGTALPLGRVRRFVAGARVVAVFTEAGPRRGDRLTPPEQLRIGVVARDGDQCKITTRWEDRSYTHGIALDTNAAGDVVALVGKCDGGMIRFDCVGYRLVVVKGQGTTLQREIPEATCASTVAISQSAEWAAVSLNDRVATYHLQGASIEEGPSIDLGDCAPAGMWRLSISDAISIVGVALSKGRVDVVCARPTSRCEVVTSQPPDDTLETDARFFQEDLFYVATTAPGVTKSRLAIFRY